MLRLGLHIPGTLSYGLGWGISWGLLAPFLPRLALRRRSAARANLPVKLLSFSLRPRLWLIVELRTAACRLCAGTSTTGLVAADLGFSSSSSITISITPLPCETPETTEFVLGLLGRYKGAGGGGGGIARCCNSFRIGGAGGGGGGGGVRLSFVGLIGCELASIVSSMPLMMFGWPLEYTGVLLRAS